MSRIGKLPIHIPQGVTVAVSPDNTVTVKGPKGQLSQQVSADLTVTVEENEVHVARHTEDKEHKAQHGLYRALLHNMVVGVSEGYTIKQELVGVGFRANAEGQVLELGLGYSHSIFLQLPAEVKVTAVTEKRANPIITLESCDKQLIGQVAAKIRSFRKPEPYKGKGIRFVGEVVRRKAGKTLLSVSSLCKEIAEKKGNKTEQAAFVGAAVAEKAKAAGIEAVVFDRNGYLYHGRVKALADAARNGGLNF